MQQTILIIDSTQAILELIALILTEAGYQVVASEQALPVAQVALLSPNLVMIENWLHGHDRPGSEICKAMKAFPPTSNIPVLLMSTQADLPTTAKYAYADGIIPKPFDIDELVKVVRKALHRFPNLARER